MNRSEHHREADSLLAKARTTEDALYRGMLLAEAQVHATLALGAPVRHLLREAGAARAATLPAV